MSNETGAELIAAERQRQIDSEGYTPEHDAAHKTHHLVSAAGAYLGLSAWPWDAASFKRASRDFYDERDLVKAGALIAAAIDRLRATGAQS